MNDTRNSMVTRKPKLIAFYLPQFHPIPENDAWWGKGFTEWTNVTRARPLFEGHYQPRLPADLGFYDLRLPDVLDAQASLARQAGIHGFCFHYYWFKGGRRLLEKPLERLLATGRPDFPFCLCWANESWTRRWDGEESETLMAQAHDPESDIDFLRSVLPYLRDPRYIRIAGRPLLLIYRASLLPDMAATIGRWRAETQRLGEAMPYLVAAETFDLPAETAAAAGFDAVCEFPPHGAAAAALARQQWPAFQSPFQGRLLDYPKVCDLFLAREAGPLRRFRTVTLDWDNTARRGSAALVTTRFSVADYHRWLSGALRASRDTAPPEEQFVFINAWNEWAEGTYLEPDQLRGHDCLAATRAAILGEAWTTTAAPPPVAERVSSAAPTAPQARATSTASGGARKLVGIAMVGNEADIVEAFVRENCRYLDRLLIAEHATLDGTRDILEALVAEGLPITVDHLDDPAYAQTAVTNRLLQAALADHGADWVLPLDADEIIDAGSRWALEQALLAAGRQHARLPWVTHVPTAFDDPQDPNPLTRLNHRYAYAIPAADENPFVWKLVVNGPLLRAYGDRYAIEKGNHRLVLRGTQESCSQPVVALTAARLRHYPVRSYDQLAAKIGIGLASPPKSSSMRVWRRS